MADERRYFNPWGCFMGVMLPDPIVEAERLSLAAKVTYGFLCRYAGRDGECYPSEDTLARKIGVSVRQLRRYIRELVEGGYVDSKRGGDGKSNRYRFVWRPEYRKHLRQDIERRSDGTGVSSKENHEESIDSDYGSTNLAPLDSSARFASIRAVLAESLGRSISDSALGRIVAAGGGASEEQLVSAIKAALVRSKDQPRRARWFEVAVAEHFDHAAGLRPAAPAGNVLAMEPREAAEMAKVFSAVEDQAA